MSNSTYTLVSAQGIAAQSMLNMLHDAKLIGDDQHTKLNAARESILEVLPKLYAELNRMGKVTGRSMVNVKMAVMQMYGRSRWADHNQMMAILEAALERFVEEYNEEEAPSAPAKVEPFIVWKSGTHKAIALRWAYGCSFITLAKEFGWRRVRETQRVIFKGCVK